MFLLWLCLMANATSIIYVYIYILYAQWHIGQMVHASVHRLADDVRPVYKNKSYSFTAIADAFVGDRHRERIVALC